MSELHAALERLGIDADRGVIDAEDRSPMQRDLLTVLKAYRAAEGALRPFAAVADKWDQVRNLPTDQMQMNLCAISEGCIGNTVFSLGHFRAARAALPVGEG